jgi:ribonuclease VapC
MILDSSAVIAIVLEEADYATLLDKVAEADDIAIGAPTLLEIRVVLSKRPNSASARLLEFLARINVRVVPFTSEHVDAALFAHARYGKGQHPAKLNFGDCMSYAVARISGQPLLYKGDDFAKTDIEAA